MFLKVIIILLIIFILYHHWYIHPELKFPDRLFQIKDIKNHETFVIVLFGILIIMFFK